MVYTQSLSRHQKTSACWRHRHIYSNHAGVGADDCAGVGRALNSPCTTAAVRRQMELSSNNQSCIIHEWVPPRRRRLTSFAHHSCSSVLMLVIRGLYRKIFSSLHRNTHGGYTAYKTLLFTFIWLCFDTIHMTKLRTNFTLWYQAKTWVFLLNIATFVFIWPLYSQNDSNP